MTSKDYRDILGGLLMILIGAFAAIYGQKYQIGQLQRMGPGFFPVVLGIILAGLGVFIAIPAFFRTGTIIRIDWKSLIWCTIGVVAFGLLLDSTGLIISSIAMIIFSSIPGVDMTWKSRILLSIAVAFITWLIFIFGLGMVIPVWPWSH
ncbi:tripartite tricarboxylate transporter TctB family protein [Orrella sp. 11846]|uniref:tripartite tricarboxylate transporter TctB family protein n=1 Tax=Orrella sp. 11846 TaxID=3409913 RepID=UPI003B5AACB8